METLYIATIKKVVDWYNAYRFFWFFPDIGVADLGGVFYDMGFLLAGMFGWL